MISQGLSEHRTTPPCLIGVVRPRGAHVHRQQGARQLPLSFARTACPQLRLLKPLQFAQSPEPLFTYLQSSASRYVIRTRHERLTAAGLESPYLPRANRVLPRLVLQYSGPSSADVLLAWQRLSRKRTQCQAQGNLWCLRCA